MINKNTKATIKNTIEPIVSISRRLKQTGLQWKSVVTSSEWKQTISFLPGVDSVAEAFAKFLSAFFAVLLLFTSPLPKLFHSLPAPCCRNRPNDEQDD